MKKERIRLTQRDKLLQKINLERKKIKEFKFQNAKRVTLVFKVSLTEELLIKKEAIKSGKYLSEFIREALLEHINSRKGKK